MIKTLLIILFGTIIAPERLLGQISVDKIPESFWILDGDNERLKAEIRTMPTFKVPPLSEALKKNILSDPSPAKLCYVKFPLRHGDQKQSD